MDREAENRHDVEDLVGGADRWRAVTQKADLQGQQQKSAGNPAHGCEKGNHACNAKGHERVDLDAGYREKYGSSNPPVMVDGDEAPGENVSFLVIIGEP
jgi:hypothetical protein